MLCWYAEKLGGSRRGSELCEDAEQRPGVKRSEPENVTTCVPSDSGFTQTVHIHIYHVIQFVSLFTHSFNEKLAIIFNQSINQKQFV